MNEIDKTNVTDQAKYRLNETTKTENYFYKEINQRKLCMKKIKWICNSLWLHRQDFNCFKPNSCWSICHSVYVVVGASVGLVSAILTLIFSLTTGIIKKLLSITRNKEKKHDKILMLAKSELSSIETLVSQALIDMEISHEEFNAIIREKKI